jgi:hypothetical protein
MRFQSKILALLLAGTAWLASPVASAQERDLSAFRAAAQDLENSLDQTTWSLDAFSLEMAVEDLDTIKARLDAHFATQVYAGVLRGADGAFAARSGNAYDQALAAIRVFNEAGYLTRIAATELDDTNISALLANVGTPQFVDAAASTTAMRQAMSRLGQASGDEALFGTLLEPLSNGWPAQPPSAKARQLGSQLADSLAGKAGTQAQEALRQDAKDYVWIQVRQSGTDAWQDVHLAFQPVSTLTATRFVESPLPDALLHRLTVRFYVETREGEDFERHRLMSDQSFPVANLGRRPLTVGVLPDALMKGQVGAELDASSFYYPILDNAMAPSAYAFTAQGFVVEAATIAAGGGVAEVFATVGARGTAATDALAALGTSAETSDGSAPATVREATGVILELTYQAPGEQPRRLFTRYLVDRIGAERRAQGAITAQDDPPQFAGRWSLHAITADVSPAEIIMRQIQQLDTIGPDSRDKTLSNPAETAALAGMFQRAVEAGLTDGHHGYRYQPLLMLTGMDIQNDVRQRLSIDILQTGLRVIDAQGQIDWAGATRAGVAETLLESGLMDEVAGIGAEVQRQGAWETLQRSSQWQWLTSEADLDELEAPAHVLLALREDIERGQWAGLVSSEASAWWRVDPSSGAVIGVNEYGQGGESAEYLAILDAVVTSMFGLYGAVQCGDDVCCQATNVAWTVTGFGVLGGGALLAEKILFAEAFTAGLVGFSAGVSMGAAGVNPFSGFCD